MVKITRQIADIFTSADKWNTFYEMCNYRDKIADDYWLRPTEKILKHYRENPCNRWFCEQYIDAQDKNNRPWDISWYLIDFGKKSLSIHIRWWYELHLRIEALNQFDTKKIDEMLKEPRYAKVLASFDRIDRQFEAESKAMEYRNYSFGSKNDNNFKDEMVDFNWYVGNETDKLVTQLIAKVDRFVRDEEITNMIYEINEKAKIK